MKIAAFSPADEKNMEYFLKMKNSLRKFHSQEEIELALIGPDQLKTMQDPMKFYRMTPVVAKQLIEKFDVLIKLDADQVITSDISHMWESDFDVAVVYNSNPRELKSFPVKVWDIHPFEYANCGFVVMKSKKFINHWYKLCHSPRFDNYQMKEQDILNIMIHYGDWRVKWLDNSDKWHGLVSKGYWPLIQLRDDKLILPKNKEWPIDDDKEIVCIHWAGGNVEKMNFKIRFNPKVVERLEWLTQDTSNTEIKKRINEKA
jgi:hypothetical protein